MSYSTHNLYSPCNELTMSPKGVAFVEKKEEEEEANNVQCCTMSWAIKWIKTFNKFSAVQVGSRLMCTVCVCNFNQS